MQGATPPVNHLHNINCLCQEKKDDGKKNDTKNGHYDEVIDNISFCLMQLGQTDMFVIYRNRSKGLGIEENFHRAEAELQSDHPDRWQAVFKPKMDAAKDALKKAGHNIP